MTPLNRKYAYTPRSTGDSTHEIAILPVSSHCTMDQPPLWVVDTGQPVRVAISSKIDEQRLFQRQRLGAHGGTERVAAGVDVVKAPDNRPHERQSFLVSLVVMSTSGNG